MWLAISDSGDEGVGSSKKFQGFSSEINVWFKNFPMYFLEQPFYKLSFSGSSVGKESAC